MTQTLSILKKRIERLHGKVSGLNVDIARQLKNSSNPYLVELNRKALELVDTLLVMNDLVDDIVDAEREE